MPLRPLAGLAALPLVVAPERVAYSPPAGAQDAQTWTVSSEWALASIDVELESGQEVAVPEIELTVRVERELELAHVHVLAGGGRPLELRRAFEDAREDVAVAFTIPDDDLAEEGSDSASSPLEGRAVVFRWDEEEGTYTRTWADEIEADAALLEGLAVDAHLAALLPPSGEAEPGDRWDADPAVLRDVLAPAGALAFEHELEADPARPWETYAAGVDPRLATDVASLLAGELDGEVEVGLVSVDGEARTAKLRVQVDLRTVTDLTSRVDPWADPGRARLDIAVTGAESRLVLEGDGELVWDLDAGLPVSFELGLDAVHGFERTADIEMDEQRDELRTRLTFEGTIDVALERH